MPAQMLRARAAHAPGPTFLSYTPNGRQLVTVGANNTIRVFETGSDGEPINIDDCQDSNTAVAAANNFFVVGSEEGSVSKYSLQSNALDQVLVRCTLPIRDIALSPDREWAAVASDELVIKIVNTNDMTRVLYIRDLAKPPKHVSFDPSGSHLAVSCTDGKIFVYSVSSEEPQLVKQLEGVTRALESEDEASSMIAWHPDGRAFATPTPTRDIQVVSRRDWERQRTFKNGHMSDVTAISWSHNGAFLATAGADRKICLWDTKSQKILKRVDDVRHTVLAFSWHPTDNILSYTTNEGELYIHNDFVPPDQLSLMEANLQPAPFIHDPLGDISGNAQKETGLYQKVGTRPRVARRGTPDSLDDILGPDEDDLDGFIEDDEAPDDEVEVNGYGKRTNGHLDSYDHMNGKRRARSPSFAPRVHECFQPGSTPWRGNRKYLCLNLTGFVWTVDQDTHHTVTVEFYDRGFHRDFHFTDTALYDKACLNAKGTLFSSQSTAEQVATIYYRPHETWTTRSDWRTQLTEGEEVTSIALSESFIVVTTSANYVRIFTLFGVPFRMYRQKSCPMVTCAAWRDYVLTIGNGALDGDGGTRLHYTIENVKRDEICQNEDCIALPEGGKIQNVFFSDAGDPYIYDSEGVLLVLEHWRNTGQARWVPVLDTRQLDRLADGKKEETYWPVAVAQEKFHCIILKGGDRYPYFPRPLLSEFDFQIPLVHAALSDETHSDTPSHEAKRLEENFVRTSLQLNLLEDLLSVTSATSAQKAVLSQKMLQIDKTLLQLLAAECVEGEERGMKALEIVALMRDQSGRMLDAAGKVAARFQRNVLGEKIRELAERRLVGLDDDEGIV